MARPLREDELGEGIPPDSPGLCPDCHQEWSPFDSECPHCAMKVLEGDAPRFGLFRWLLLLTVIGLIATTCIVVFAC